MTTKVGTGASSNRDTVAALKEALGHALWKLDGKSPSFGFLFLGPKHDVAHAAASAQKQLGRAPLLTSTTAGELTELGYSHDGLVVMLVASDSFEFKANLALGLKAQVAKVAERLCDGLGDTKRTAQSGGRRHMTTVLLTDGLAGTGEDLVQQMFERMHSVSRIVGGAAGDEAKFDRTLVGLGATVAADSAVALHVFSRKPWGVGVDHGLRPTSSPMRVTRAKDNVVHEIDGAPAFEAYRAHAAKRGITLSHANAAPYMIANEIGIHFFERITRARAPLSTDARARSPALPRSPKDR
ncbi:MAG: FIST N-terminal domain-containing protein [Pseudomonadota bacterium]